MKQLWILLIILFVTSLLAIYPQAEAAPQPPPQQKMDPLMTGTATGTPTDTNEALSSQRPADGAITTPPGSQLPLDSMNRRSVPQREERRSYNSQPQQNCAPNDVACQRSQDPMNFR